MKRYFIISAIVCVSFFLQTSVMEKLAIWGIFPDLLAAVVVSVSLLQGQWTGAFCGLISGFLLDVLFSTTPGIYTLQYALAGLIGGIGGKVRIHTYKFVLPLILCFAAMVAKECFFPVYAFFSGAEMSAPTVLLRIFSRALYTTVVMFAVYQPLYLLHKAEFMGVNRLFAEPSEPE